MAAARRGYHRGMSTGRQAPAPGPDAGFPKAVGAPATRALVAAGYTDLRQVAGVPAGELARLHGVGPKALAVLQEALRHQGLSLG